MEISELKGKENIFGKLYATVKGWGHIITYGYIREVNCKYATFEDSTQKGFKYKVYNVESFEPMDFKDLSKT